MLVKQKISLLGTILMASVILAGCSSGGGSTTDGNENASDEVAVEQIGEICRKLEFSFIVEEVWIREPVNPVAVSEGSTKKDLLSSSSDSCIVQGITNGTPFEVAVFKMNENTDAEAAVQNLRAEYSLLGTGVLSDVSNGFRLTASSGGSTADTTIYYSGDLVLVIFSPSNSDGVNGVYQEVVTIFP